MTSGRVFQTKSGPGQTWQRRYSNIMSAEQTPRWWPLDYGLSSQIQSRGAQNASGQTWEDVYNLKTADQKAREENFKF